MDLTEPRASRYREAYLRMAKEARYRPQAPGGGIGHVSLTRKQLADPELLQREATAYALKFNAEENERAFWIEDPVLSSRVPLQDSWRVLKTRKDSDSHPPPFPAGGLPVCTGPSCKILEKPCKDFSSLCGTKDK